MIPLVIERFRVFGALGRNRLQPVLLTLNRPSVNDDGTKLKFVVDDFQYEYDLVAEKIVKLGKAPPLPALTPPNGITSREELERWRDERALELAARKLAVQLFPEGKSTEINYDGRRAEVSS